MINYFQKLFARLITGLVRRYGNPPRLSAWVHEDGMNCDAAFIYALAGERGLRVERYSYGSYRLTHYLEHRHLGCRAITDFAETVLTFMKPDAKGIRHVRVHLPHGTLIHLFYDDKNPVAVTAGAGYETRLKVFYGLPF